MKPQHFFLAIVIAFCWGVNFIMAKIGLRHFPPMMLMGLRFSLVALCLMPFYFRAKVNHKKIAWMGLNYGLGYHTLVFSGLWKGLSVGAGVIAVQMHVPFTALLGIWLLKDPLGWRRTLGMVTAFTGMVILVGSPSVTEHLSGFFLVLAGAVSWAIYNIQVKNLGKTPVLPFLAWFGFFSGILLVSVSLLIEKPSLSLFTSIPYPVMGVLAYMVVLTTIVGMGLWSYLIGLYSVHQVTPFSMLAPVFGVIGASLILGETLSWQVLLGGAITIIGVTIIVLRRPAVTLEGPVNG